MQVCIAKWLYYGHLVQCSYSEILVPCREERRSHVFKLKNSVSNYLVTKWYPWKCLCNSTVSITQKGSINFLVLRGYWKEAAVSLWALVMGQVQGIPLKAMEACKWKRQGPQKVTALSNLQAKIRYYFWTFQKYLRRAKSQEGLSIGIQVSMLMKTYWWEIWVT